MYMPTLRDARPVARYVIGPYIAVVLTDCESVGMIDYKHVLMVYLPEPQSHTKPQVVLAVAAELSSYLIENDPEHDQPAYFMGVFPGDGHHNLGASPDWSDLKKFTTQALKVACKHLHIQRKPIRVSDEPVYH
jgi:hypothetical protein